MSSDEQDAAALRLLRERADVKRHRALLEGEIQAAGKVFSQVGVTVEHLNINMDLPYVLALVEKHAKAPSPGKVAEMMKEYIDLSAHLSTLNARIQDAGLE
jgi:hypothetical protein